MPEVDPTKDVSDEVAESKVLSEVVATKVASVVADAKVASPVVVKKENPLKTATTRETSRPDGTPVFNTIGVIEAVVLLVVKAR